MNIRKISRTFAPEIIAPGTGLSPLTEKSRIPTNNIPTIQDVLNGKPYKLPGGGGDWSSGHGEDTFKSYKENGDAYKRRERDLELFNKMLSDTEEPHEEKWRVKIPGGYRIFDSFHNLQRFQKQMNEKGVKIQYIQKIAENKNPKIIANSLEKTFKIECTRYSSTNKQVGSAFCIDSNKFFTCAHVVKDCDKFKLIQDENEYECYLIKQDDRNDIALLECKVNVDPFIFNNSNLYIGQDVIVIGSPYGYENNVSFGNITSINKKIYGNGYPDYFFLDAPVFEGNSGGPILDANNGTIIGMITSIVSKESNYGLNIGLPTSYLKDFLKIG